MNKYWKKIFKIVILTVIVLILGFAIFLCFKKPSHDRDWEMGHEKLPSVEISGDEVVIENFRDFIWNGEVSAQERYKTKKLKLSKLQKTEFIISHFSEFEGLAHVFLNFVFSDGEEIIMSMETRRDGGEEFSPTLGLLRKFETIYVLGSYEDIIGVRTDFRDERVYVYPTIFNQDDSQKLFLKIAKDINGIYAQPKFYNTLFNNCMNAISRPIESVSDFNFPFTYKIIMPGYIDEVLYEMGMIQNPSNKTFSEIKDQYLLKTEEKEKNIPDCEELKPTREQIDEAVDEALIGLENPWGDSDEWGILIERIEIKLNCTLKTKDIIAK